MERDGFRRAARSSVWIGIAGLTLGCNAVLDNQPGELAGADAATAAPDASRGDGYDATVAPVTPTPVAPAPDDAASPPATVEDAAIAPPSAVDAGILPVCAFGQKLCEGSCVAIDDPLFGCGETTCTPCSLSRASATCAGDGCAIASCDPGYADCDQKATDGCETDLSQAAHCGTCNAKCTSVDPDCAPTAGGFACTTGCGAAAPTLCGSQCVNLQTALDDCGSCSNACPAVANGQATCASGHCGFTCESGFHACGSGCASTMSPSTCGTSCTACPAGANAIATCDGVACGIACEPHFANCDGLASNGCEVDLLSNSANCGQCGVSCDGRACAAGQCAPPPPDAGPPPPVDSGPPPPPPADSGASGSGGSDASGD